MNQQHISSTQTQQERLNVITMLLREKFSLIVIFISLTMAFLIEISPKWNEWFRIPLSPGHSFTNQDLAAVIAVAIALAVLSRIIRKYLPDIKHYIEHNPYKALTLTLIFSTSVSLILGIGLGMLFKTPIVDFLTAILKPLRSLIFG